MIQWLIIATVFVVDPGLVPRTRMKWLTIACDSNSRRSKDLFWSPRYCRRLNSCRHIHICIYKNKQIHISKNKVKYSKWSYQLLHKT